MQTLDHYKTYWGRYSCPRCGSKQTGSDAIATSSRWMNFRCHDCFRLFRKSAANVSSLSAKLRGLVGNI